nr:glycosyltransferase family 2 protein [Geotalea sp. SG265]
MLPEISVVIPAFNRADTIEYCLSSVVNQTVPPCEIIVVDDCSLDHTVEVVKKFQDPRVRCIIQDVNSGAQAARNRGIRESIGEWVAFLDSDDEWLPSKIEKQVAALYSVKFDPMTVVHSDCYRIDHVSGTKTLCSIPLTHGISVSKTVLSSIGPMFQGMLTSKTALKSIGLLDVNVPSYQEWDTAIMLANCCRFIHIREPLFAYHLHHGETISKDKLKDIRGYQYVVNKHQEEIVKYCGISTLNGHLISSAQRALNWEYFDEASEVLAKTVGTSCEIVLLEWLARKKITYDSHRKANPLVRMSRMLWAYAEKLFNK